MTSAGATVHATTFGADRLALISTLESWHFWFTGRRLLVDQLWARHVGPGSRRVLEIGCGSGRYSKKMAGRGHDVVGLDLRAEGLRAIHEDRGSLKVVQASGTELPFEAGSFDAVILMDILEHADDAAILAEVRRVLRPGGALILTVPAIPWLWSYRDDAAGHLRRYTRETLTRVLRGARFETVAMQYYQCILFPLVAMTRLAGRSVRSTRELEERPGRVTNAIFGILTRAEVRLGSFVRWPWGSSLAAACRKP